MGWVTGWTYRKSHTITPSAGAGQNYQKRIVVHFSAGTDSGEDIYLSGKCKANFGDIRFTNSSGAFLLDHWLDKKVDGNYAIFWVKVSDDLSTYDKKIYIYYGNASALSASNGDATFIFFDDFETNLNRWSCFGLTGLRFSGSNNLGSPLGFGTIADFDGLSPFTLECWFRTSGTGEQPLITRMNLDGNGRGYCLFVINNHIGYELRSNRTPSSDIQIETNVRTINDGNWHHLVASYDGSRQASGIHIYLDGTEEPFTTLVNTLNDTISNPSRFNVATYGGFYYFTGDIDEIVVYTSVLTLVDIVARYNNGEGTEDILGGTVYAHWPLDEGSGGDVVDVSGHPERNLWLVTAGGPMPAWITGIIGAPVPSFDHAYSGTKGAKIPIATLMSHNQLPYDNIAVHVHLYDEMLPVPEYTVFSIDAGEAEVSFIGLITDGDQYEYQLLGINYNSGVPRTIGWHEFITRSSLGLKQFIIDGNIMPVTGVGVWNPVTFLIVAGTSQAVAYWDSIFYTKFVSPEPAHGEWGAEETGSGVTTFIAEDIESSVPEKARTLDDVIYLLAQHPLNVEDALVTLLGSLHLPTSSEDLLVVLSKYFHIPISSEELLEVLTKKFRSVEELVLALSETLHIPISSEDLITSLASFLHIPILSEDMLLVLLAKRILSTEEVILSLLAQRILQGQDTIYERSLLYRSRLMAFPIFGGSHVIQVKGEEG